MKNLIIGIAVSVILLVLFWQTSELGRLYRRTDVPQQQIDVLTQTVKAQQRNLEADGHSLDALDQRFYLLGLMPKKQK